ncbi:MAG: hypothetical protein ACTS77_03775 [Arsenophonus sp. NC-TX2-MAG3]
MKYSRILFLQLSKPFYAKDKNNHIGSVMTINLIDDKRYASLFSL